MRTKSQISQTCKAIIALLLALAMCLPKWDAANLVTAQESSNLSTPELILQAQEMGQIDADTANLYLAYALGNYEKLPQDYLSKVPWEGTLILMDLTNTLSSRTSGRYQKEIADILTTSSGCGTSTISLPHVYNSSQYFYIEYDTISGGLSISDYAISLDTAWTTEIRTFGWKAPPVFTSHPPPGNRYHVRIDNLGSGLLGFTSKIGTYAGSVGNNPNTDWDDRDSQATCMVLANDYSPYSSLGSVYQLLDQTTAHEFNHAIQYGYGALTPLCGSNDQKCESNPSAIIFIEGGANWMVDEVFDAANITYKYLWPTFTLPMGQYTDNNSYNYWITFRGLTEPYGTGVPDGGEQIMQDFWEILSRNNSAEAIAALDAALHNRGTSLNTAFHNYAITVKFNKTCGAGFLSPFCFEEAAGYVGAAGMPSVPHSIPSVRSSYLGNIADSYAINWVGLPTGSTAYQVTLQNTDASGGSLRGSIVCDTGSTLKWTPLPSVIGAGSSTSIGNFNPLGCRSIVAVITNQSIATPSTVRSYRLSTSLPGDANRDGIVDGLDYVIWLNNYNKRTSNGPSNGDFNNDGIVDGLDYVIWLNNYGK